MKRLLTDWEENILAIHLSDQGFENRIDEEFQQLSDIKVGNPITNRLKL